MATKRTIEEVEDFSAEAAPAPQTTAAMAHRLQERLLVSHKAQNKYRGIYKRSTLDLSTINPTLNPVGFFKLDREHRDQIYQMLWSETPRVKQRYKRRVFEVTYGDVPVCPDLHPDIEMNIHTTDAIKFKVPWLMICKQMLLEGFTEFHQRSIWRFKARYHEVLPQEYIFPLMTPALAWEHHLDIINAQYYLSMVQYPLEDDTPGDEVVHIGSPKSDLIAVVNLMTVSAEAHDAGSKIKLTMSLRIDSLGEYIYTPGMWKYRHLENSKLDLSKLDRLAVHKHLRTFEVNVNLVFSFLGAAERPERFEKALENLMVELEIVGNALIPGGVTSRQTPVSGWASQPLPHNNPTTFTIKVETASA